MVVCGASRQRGRRRGLTPTGRLHKMLRLREQNLSPGGAWRSLVAHLLWEQRVAGSNPAAPTILPMVTPAFDEESTHA
jgi:hypothetical protein